MFRLTLDGVVIHPSLRSSLLPNLAPKRTKKEVRRDLCTRNDKVRHSTRHLFQARLLKELERGQSLWLHET